VPDLLGVVDFFFVESDMVDKGFDVVPVIFKKYFKQVSLILKILKIDDFGVFPDLFGKSDGQKTKEYHQ
jgi:hypothetical protein